MAIKQEWEYIGRPYRQLDLEPGTVLEFNPRTTPEGRVTVKIPGSSVRRKLHIAYDDEESFRKNWKEVGLDDYDKPVREDL